MNVLCNSTAKCHILTLLDDDENRKLFDQIWKINGTTFRLLKAAIT